jgi:hypothetical protein
MATISNQTLTVQNLNNTTVRVNVRYRLNPSQNERLNGSVFRENIQLIGDDPGVATDVVISAIPESLFRVSSSTLVVDRSRIIDVLKSAMNEDPAFLATGAESVDEVFARISVVYGGSAPIPPEIPTPSSTSRVSGAWK